MVNLVYPPDFYFNGGVNTREQFHGIRDARSCSNHHISN